MRLYFISLKLLNCDIFVNRPMRKKLKFVAWTVPEMWSL